MTTQITAPPTAPQRDDPDTFPDRSDAWVQWQEDHLVPEMNAVNQEVAANAASAQSAFALASNANGTAGTSTTAYTPVVGSASFTYVESSRTPLVGMRLHVASASAPATNWAEGVITAWNSGTGAVTVSVDKIGPGPASNSSWNLFAVGLPGSDGSVQPLRTVTVSGSVTVADRGKQIDVTAAGVTLTPDAPGTLADGFTCTINAVGFPVTISATFNDGRTTKVLQMGHAARLSSNGSSIRLQLMPQVHKAFGTPGTAVVHSAVAPKAFDLCAMTSTRGFMLWNNGTNTLLTLIDDTGAIIAGPTTIEAALCTSLSIAAIDSSRAILCWTSGANCKVQIASFSGTTITTGTASTVSSGNTAPKGCIALLNSSKAVVMYGDSGTNNLTARVVNIGAGTTISSVGTAATATATGGCNPPRMAAVNATQLIAAYVLASGGDYSPRVQVLTESAGTLTWNTQVGGMWSADATANVDVVAINSAGRALLVGGGGSASFANANNCSAVVMEVSGTGASAYVRFGSHRLVSGSWAGNGGPLAINARLVKVSADTYVRVHAVAESLSSLSAQILTVRDWGVLPEAAAMCIGRIGTGFGFAAALMNNKLVLAQADAENSGFASVRPVPLNSVA